MNCNLSTTLYRHSALQHLEHQPLLAWYPTRRTTEQGGKLYYIYYPRSSPYFGLTREVRLSDPASACSFSNLQAESSALPTVSSSPLPFHAGFHLNTQPPSGQSPSSSGHAGGCFPNACTRTRGNRSSCSENILHCAGNKTVAIRAQQYK